MAMANMNLIGVFVTKLWPVQALACGGGGGGGGGTKNIIPPKFSNFGDILIKFRKRGHMAVYMKYNGTKRLVIHDFLLNRYSWLLSTLITRALFLVIQSVVHVLLSNAFLMIFFYSPPLGILRHSIDQLTGEQIKTV